MTLTDLCRRAFLGMIGTALVALGLYVALCSQQVFGVLRRALGVSGALLVVWALGTPASASELAASVPVGTGGIVMHDASETLSRYCRRDPTGRLWFNAPGGASFELVTSVSDPSIVNKGDGEFHAYDAAEVRATLAAVRYPLDRISVEIFLLPYPRAGALESAAGPGLILLAPGVRPLSREHQHSELTHELGHIVQYARMPDHDAASWAAYRSLRGIDDPSVYFAGAPHADRPHEIFAEDFRALFGDPLANYSQTVENSSITPPSQVAGLSSFIQSLTGGPLPVALAPIVNPVRGAVEFMRSGTSDSPLDLFDVTGRRLATLAPVAVQGGTAWHWNGRGAAGQRFSGTAFARLRRGDGAVARVTVLN